ncbi:hypothetical protein NM208_g13432 [Fusarium decemcellulare]|uniref:Uncharacterized protein n=1 Tax=Fusarium decemcellulare TaxID=57161 RepID=A0ACC1RLM8_9HYPO|nr:hypothetical protein NM208_g13432 [Fusarium decemcellulare]
MVLCSLASFAQKADPKTSGSEDGRLGKLICTCLLIHINLAAFRAEGLKAPAQFAMSAQHPLRLDAVLDSPWRLTRYIQTPVPRTRPIPSPDDDGRWATMPLIDSAHPGGFDQAFLFDFLFQTSLLGTVVASSKLPYEMIAGPLLQVRGQIYTQPANNCLLARLPAKYFSTASGHLVITISDSFPNRPHGLGTRFLSPAHYQFLSRHWQ